MEEPREPDLHPFEQFKATMRKLVTVSKADLDAQLKRHAESTHKQRPGRKPLTARAERLSPAEKVVSKRCEKSK